MAERKYPVPEDDRDRKLLADIKRVGWAVMMVSADKDGPGFAYSIGLYETLSHAEILIMGLPPQTAQQLINLMGYAIQDGKQFEAGKRYDDLADGLPLALITMDKRYYRDYLGYAGWFYDGWEFPVLQCIWPDKEGVFPGEQGYDSRFFQNQRVLGST